MHDVIDDGLTPTPSTWSHTSVNQGLPLLAHWVLWRGDCGAAAGSAAAISSVRVAFRLGLLWRRSTQQTRNARRSHPSDAETQWLGQLGRDPRHGKVRGLRVNVFDPLESNSVCQLQDV